MSRRRYPSRPKPLSAVYSLSRLLTCTICEIDVFGWVSGSEAFKKGLTSTKENVAAMLDKTITGEARQESLIELARGESYDLFGVQDEVDAIIHWARAISGTSRDYPVNLQRIAAHDDVIARDFGTACSMVSAYRKHLQDATNSASQSFVGKLKERVSLCATVVSSKSGMGNFGEWFLFKFVTDKNENITIFFNKRVAYATGDRVNITATVTKHEMFNGEKHTVMNRAKTALA